MRDRNMINRDYLEAKKILEKLEAELAVVNEKEGHAFKRRGVEVEQKEMSLAIKYPKEKMPALVSHEDLPSFMRFVTAYAGRNKIVL